MLAILPELEAATFALPCGSGLSHLVGLAFASLDLDGLCGLVGVVGIPILSGFGAPAKQLLGILHSRIVGNLNPNTGRNSIKLVPPSPQDTRRPGNYESPVRRNLGRHTQQPIAQRFRAGSFQC